MTRLFIVSVATGYGGAERSIEIIASHLPATLETSIYAAHPEHLARLAAIAATRPQLRIVKLSARPKLLSRRLAALKLLADFRRLAPAAILINTQAAALLCAMVARHAPQLAERAALYIRDFLWQDLDYIFARLAKARVLVPSRAVTDRVGYLFPFHLGPDGRTATIAPDMVELPAPAPPLDDGFFLHLATVNPFKGHAELMLAARRLQASGPAPLIRAAGHAPDPRLRRHLLALRDRLGLAGSFELMGYVAEPAALLAACRAVVVPSISHSGGPETFGRAVIEAWAHKKPVIAFAAGAPAHLIAHEEDGLLVPEGDIAALAAALARLREDAALCRRLGEVGYRKAAAQFEAQAVTRQLLAALGLGASA